MFGFGKKKNAKPPKDTESVEFRRWMADKINSKPLRYVLEREDDGTERIIGKSGFISVADGLLSVTCGEKTLFLSEVDSLRAWEFLSLEGASLTGFDLIESRERTILAYYKYYRD